MSKTPLIFRIKAFVDYMVSTSPHVVHQELNTKVHEAMAKYDIPSVYKHHYYKVVRWEHDYGFTNETVRCSKEESDLVSSELVDYPGGHSLMLDIDLPAQLIPSGTPGHTHLYIDHKMTWRKYKRLIKELKRAGIIEAGFANSSIARKSTDLRVPWKKKGQHV